MSALQFTHLPDWHAMIVRDTFPNLTAPDAILDRARNWLIPQGIRWDGVERRFTFPSGSTVTFRHLADSGSHLNLQGASYSGLFIDEVCNIPSTQIAFLESRIRSTNPDIPLQFRCAGNPIGVSKNWIKRRFVDKPNTTKSVFLPGLLKDNPHLNPDDYVPQFDNLDPVTRLAMLEGRWDVSPVTNFIDCDKIKLINRIPDQPWRWVRSYDYAATETKPGNDPDYTAGLLVGEHDGEFLVADVDTFKLEPGPAIERIKINAQKDTHSVRIIGEKEGGSSGKYVTTMMAKELVGFYYEGIPVSGKGSKVERARVIASSAQNGLLYVLDREWTDGLMNELMAFPTKGVHDDQVDSLSQAITYWGQPKPYVY